MYGLGSVALLIYYRWPLTGKTSLRQRAGGGGIAIGSLLIGGLEVGGRRVRRVLI